MAARFTVISAYWKLFQASDWPTWFYGLDYIATCWFCMLLKVPHSMHLRFHVDRDFFFLKRKKEKLCL